MTTKCANLTKRPVDPIEEDLKANPLTFEDRQRLAQTKLDPEHIIDKLWECEVLLKPHVDPTSGETNPLSPQLLKQTVERANLLLKMLNKTLPDLKTHEHTGNLEHNHQHLHAHSKIVSSDIWLAQQVMHTVADVIEHEQTPAQTDDRPSLL